MSPTETNHSIPFNPILFAPRTKGGNLVLFIAPVLPDYEETDYHVIIQSLDGDMNYYMLYTNEGKVRQNDPDEYPQYAEQFTLFELVPCDDIKASAPQTEVFNNQEKRISSLLSYKQYIQNTVEEYGSYIP